jgi:hypothetical protein
MLDADIPLKKEANRLVSVDEGFVTAAPHHR